MRFTKDNVFKIKPPADKSDYIEWDEAMPGFGIRFRNQGPGVYMIQYRVNGRNGRMALGAISKITLVDAQKRARDHFNQIADNIDPAVEKAKAEAAAVLFKSKIDAYQDNLRTLGRSDKYVDDVRRSLGGDFGQESEVKGYYSGLYKIAFSELNRAMVAREQADIEKEHGSGAMRNSRSHVNSYLTWAQKEGYLDVHPGEATRKPPTVKRQRKLETWEIIPVWSMLDPADDFGAIGKLLWLTWARRNEIAALRKKEVDRKKRLIFLKGTDDRTKNGYDHVIPLSRQAWAILEPKLDQRTDSEFVFGSGAGPFSGFTRATDRLRDMSLAKLKQLREMTGETENEDVEHFTLHDFRRTARSLGVRKPVSIFPHIAEAILSHISTAESGKAGVAGVYDVNDPWQYHEEKTEALQAWADYLDSLTRPKLSIVA